MQTCRPDRPLGVLRAVRHACCRTVGAKLALEQGMSQTRMANTDVTRLRLLFDPLTSILETCQRSVSWSGDDIGGGVDKG